MDSSPAAGPTPSERACFDAIGHAKREPLGLTPQERMTAGLVAMQRLNELRRAKGLAPFAPVEPPDELGFYERARARDLLG